MDDREAILLANRPVFCSSRRPKTMRTVALILVVLGAACRGRNDIIRTVADGPPGNESFRVAVLHLKSVGGDRSTPEGAQQVLEANSRRAEQLIRLAADAGAEIVVTPEYLNSGNRLKAAELPHVASAVPDPSSKLPLWGYDHVQPFLIRYARLAAELRRYVVTQTVERTDVGGETLYYNTLVAFAPDGRVAAKYRKINLWMYENWIEESGQDTGCLETPHGRFGLLLCLDVVVPWTWARTKREHDVDFYILSSNWQHTPVPGRAACNLLAVLSGRPVVWSNQARGGTAGDAGIIRPGAADTAMGVWGPQGVVVGNLPLPERLLAEAVLAPAPPCPVLRQSR